MKANRGPLLNISDHPGHHYSEGDHPDLVYRFTNRDIPQGRNDKVMYGTSSLLRELPFHSFTQPQLYKPLVVFVRHFETFQNSIWSQCLLSKLSNISSHTIHVTGIFACICLIFLYGKNVGKYTFLRRPMGLESWEWMLRFE